MFDAKCVRFYKFGRPLDVLKVEDKNIESPKDHEILVRMLTRPINPSDLIPISGAYSHRIPLPQIPGYEGVGIVEEVGASVSKNLIGSRVLPLGGEGTWQEYVKTSGDLAISIPASIDDFTASQMYINPLTAWVVCKEVLKLRADDILLVNACGSALGHIFAQLSSILGFRFIAVTRNDRYTERLLELGASDVIDTSKASLYERVLELTNGKGADAAIDCIGGLSGNNLAFCVHPNGNFLSIGLLSGVQVNWANIVKYAKVHTNIFHLRHWNNRISIKKWQETFDELIQLIDQKKLQLRTADSCYDLSDVKQAIRRLESSKTNKGKIILTSDVR